MTKLVYHPFIMFITTIVAIVFFISLDKSSHKTEISSENIKILEEEVHKMSNETIELEEKIIEADSEIFKEKVVRNELLLQKPGERVIQIPDTKGQETLDSIEYNEDKPIKKWLDLIF
jgi:cell division protein FtsB